MEETTPATDPVSRIQVYQTELQRLQTLKADKEAELQQVIAEINMCLGALREYKYLEQAVGVEEAPPPDNRQQRRQRGRQSGKNLKVVATDKTAEAGTDTSPAEAATTT